MASINGINNTIPANNFTVPAGTITASGNIQTTAGNLVIPTTSSTVGQLVQNGTRLLHTFGTRNIFLGDSAGNFTLSGIANTGVGSFTTLSALTSGQLNCAFGDATGIAIQDGQRNCMFGQNSGTAIVSSADNAFFGHSTGHLTSGGSNTMIGAFSTTGGGTFAGTDNTWIGRGTGNNLTTTGSSNIYIGSAVAGTLAESNKLRIGSATGTGTGNLNASFICGIDGVNVGSVSKVLTMASDQLGTATITAGAGISVTPTANTITIAATGAGFTWAVTTVNASIVVENGYIANKAGLLTMTLPSTAAIGDTFIITGINTAVGWRIAQNALQQIFFGTSSTTIGVTGYLEATAIRDSVELVCVVAGTSTNWNVLSSVGNITVV